MRAALDVVICWSPWQQTAADEWRLISHEKTDSCTDRIAAGNEHISTPGVISLDDKYRWSIIVSSRSVMQNCRLVGMESPIITTNIISGICSAHFSISRYCFLSFSFYSALLFIVAVDWTGWPPQRRFAMALYKLLSQLFHSKIMDAKML